MKATIVSSILIFAVQGQAQSLLGEPAKIESSSENDRYQQKQLTLFGGLGYQDYQISTGGGPSVNISNSQITKFGLAGKWNHKTQNFGIFASYGRHETALKAPSSISPSTVFVREQIGKIAITSKLFKDTGTWFEPWEIGFGFSQSQRTADRTTPSELVSDETKSGPFLMLSTIRQLNESFYYSFRADLSLVTQFRENSATTGNYTSGYGFDTKFLLIYPTSRFVDISLGLQIYYEGVNFYGTGQRSLTDAQESSLGIIVPLEITIFF